MEPVVSDRSVARGRGQERTGPTRATTRWAGGLLLLLVTVMFGGVSLLRGANDEEWTV